MTYDEILSSIDNHLFQSTKRFYKDFYIGITDDIENCLFGSHNVDRNSDWWIYCPANSEEIAKRIRTYFLDKGMAGNSTDEKQGSNCVYCYEITNKSRQ